MMSTASATLTPHWRFSCKREQSGDTALDSSGDSAPATVEYEHDTRAHTKTERKSKTGFRAGLELGDSYMS